MASFTPEFFLRVLGVRKRFPHDRVLEMLALIRVANNTRFTARVFAVGLSRRWRACACDLACAGKSEEEHGGHE
jgi:hypothetical protein